jgi:hypothetical protein
LCCDIELWQYLLGWQHILGGDVPFGIAMQECALDYVAEALPEISAQRKKDNGMIAKRRMESSRESTGPKFNGKSKKLEYNSRAI